MGARHFFGVAFQRKQICYYENLELSIGDIVDTLSTGQFTYYTSFILLPSKYIYQHAIAHMSRISTHEEFVFYNHIYIYILAHQLYLISTDNPENPTSSQAERKGCKKKDKDKLMESGSKIQPAYQLTYLPNRNSKYSQVPFIYNTKL